MLLRLLQRSCLLNARLEYSRSDLVFKQLRFRNNFIFGMLYSHTNHSNVGKKENCKYVSRYYHFCFLEDLVNFCSHSEVLYEIKTCKEVPNPPPKLQTCTFLLTYDYGIILWAMLQSIDGHGIRVKLHSSRFSFRT